MDNTREKYAKNPCEGFWRAPSKTFYMYDEKWLSRAQKEIVAQLDQLTKELKQIKIILNMETDDGK